MLCTHRINVKYSNECVWAKSVDQNQMFCGIWSGSTLFVIYPTLLKTEKPLRKHAYSNILKILPPKWEILDKNSDIFHISAQNIDCGYLIELLCQSSSKEIFSTVILSLPLIQEGQLSVSGERMCTILVNRLED